MTKKILTIALAVLAAALCASPALAAKAPHRYSPKHGAKCRKTYKRVKHGKRVYCVKQKAKVPPTTAAPVRPPAPSTPATTEKVKLHAHLDPSFTRNPMDPFEVTYAYSASASQQKFTTDSALALSPEESAPLPSGVLSFFSDGKLECAVNVGSGVEGSECPVSYAALGEHRVTTIYTSGEQSATETEVEDIAPLATETTLTVNYEAVTPHEVSGGLWLVGNLTANAGASPSGRVATLGCGEGATDHLTTSDCYQVTGADQHVYVNPVGSCAAPEIGAIYIAESPSTAGSPLTAEALEAGDYHLRASVTASPGYVGSEAIAAIRLTPEVTFPPNC